MCGIFGILGVERVASSAIGQMLAGLKHRGPDAQNYMEIAPNYVLGMTRLAINGIENIQNQPMINPDTGDILIFNGEIYNFSN